MGWAVGEVAGCNRWEGGREEEGHQRSIARLSPTRMQLLGFLGWSHRKGILLYHRVLAGARGQRSIRGGNLIVPQRMCVFVLISSSIPTGLIYMHKHSVR